MKALKINRASAAPDEGSKESINGGIKNMKRNKGMQLKDRAQAKDHLYYEIEAKEQWRLKKS